MEKQKVSHLILNISSSEFCALLLYLTNGKQGNALLTYNFTARKHIKRTITKLLSFVQFLIYYIAATQL